MGKPCTVLKEAVLNSAICSRIPKTA